MLSKYPYCTSYGIVLGGVWAYQLVILDSSNSQELCLRSSLESQSSTSTSADPVLGLQPNKTRKLGFTTQKIRTQFSPPVLSEANSNIFAVLLADLVRNTSETASRCNVVLYVEYTFTCSIRTRSMHTVCICQEYAYFLCTMYTPRIVISLLASSSRMILLMQVRSGTLVVSTRSRLVCMHTTQQQYMILIVCILLQPVASNNNNTLVLCTPTSNKQYYQFSMHNIMDNKTLVT